MDLEGADDLQRAPTDNDDGASGSPTTRSNVTSDEDANPTGAVSGPDDFTTTRVRGDGTGPDLSGTPSRITPDTPEPVSTGIAQSGSSTDVTPAAGARSDLYSEPVSFEGRSLEGAPRAGDPKELAQSLDGAEIPVENLPRVEPDTAKPARKSILKNSDGTPVSDSYRELQDEAIQARFERARDNKRWFNDGTSATDSVWTDTMWSGERNRTAAWREANARWSEFAAAQRTSSVSFSDDPRQLTYLVEHEATVYSRSRGRYVDLYRGAEPPNTIDRAHAALHPQTPRLGAGTRDRIRPALARVERVPVLAPRADREHAIERRVPEPQSDRRTRVGPRGLPRCRRRVPLVPVPGDGGHGLRSGRPTPAWPVAHAGLAPPAPPPAHRDARLRGRGGVSAFSRGPRRSPSVSVLNGEPEPDVRQSRSSVTN